MDSGEAGRLVGEFIKPFLLLALGSWFGYRYIKKRKEKMFKELEGGKK